MIEEHYNVGLTSAEITEVIAALYAREIALNDSIKLLARKHQFEAAAEQQRRLATCKSAIFAIQYLDKK